MKPNKHLRFEALESRLAPANLFVSAAALTVKDAVGNDAQNLASEISAMQCLISPTLYLPMISGAIRSLPTAAATRLASSRTV